MTEQTLVLVKPDGVQRGLVGEVLARIEAKGYRLVRIDRRRAGADLLQRHYAEHVGKDFFPSLLEFMSSGPLVSVVVEGHRAIEGFRSLAGTTDPTVAAPGTIRGDLGRDWGQGSTENLVHGSDGEQSAAREIAIWYPDGPGTPVVPPGSCGAEHVAVGQSLVLVKPDGVARGVVGPILRRIETKGYRITALRLRDADADLLAAHYAEHVGKPFYPELVEFMSSGPVVAAVIEGERVVEGWRSLMGTTDSTAAAPGSIRGDLGRDWGNGSTENLAHGSDSAESAVREIALWFPAPAG